MHTSYSLGNQLIGNNKTPQERHSALVLVFLSLSLISCECFNGIAIHLHDKRGDLALIIYNH